MTIAICISYDHGKNGVQWKYNSMENQRDKKRKFTNRKQQADGESISCSCFLIL